MAVLLDYSLTTLADVKESLGLSSGDTSKDNLIIRKINQATRMIENYCDCRFKETTYTGELYDGHGGNELVLRHKPIISVTSLAYRNVPTNENYFTTVDATDYYVKEEYGVIEFLAPFTQWIDRWQVTYSAGYTTIPEDVAEACATLAAYLVVNGTSGTNVKRKREGQREIEYFDATSKSGDSIIDQLGLSDVLSAYASPVISGLN
ncbi:phage gp6-like head-tail connector protein [Candidatus Saccharibacteria bacterium]|nr:MAG: phage gp6-like head-tail connector protein [Candidatus Saccharibacteria bacterium]